MSLNDTASTFLRNPVCRVRFAGFTSDTLTLQQAGWQVAAQQDVERGSVGLCLRHKSGWYAVTNHVGYSELLRSSLREPMRSMLVNYGSGEFALTFDVVTFSSDVRMAYMVQPSSVAWNAVDCFPQATAMSVHEHKLEDLVPFLPLNHNAEQIIVAPESVPQVLDLLLKCQAPAAAERRQRDKARAWCEAAQIQAQVLVA